jgi:nicotinamide-nucleotide amidase
MQDHSDEGRKLAEQVATLARTRGMKVAVAESLTSGTIACHLGAAREASSWFVGGVVAYAAEVKFEVLGVEPGPVMTGRCAAQMAAGVARLLGADIAVAVTGVGGPGPDEGHPAGTVYLAVSSGPLKAENVIQHHFDGDPAQVVELSTISALQLLQTTLKAAKPRTSAA